MDDATRLALAGTAQPEPPARRLVAGPLAAELVAGALAAVRFDGIEVLRAIGYLVRDRDWGTYAPALDDMVVEEAPDRFAVRYRSRCRSPEGVLLTVAVAIEGTAAGTLAMEATAVADGAFETNRCGFCVLHPIRGLAGRPVRVEHGDGRVEQTHLPDLIAPWQPFKDIRAITHAVRPGLHATCRFEGDTFEMEDQRAWSDASYKTYVRPLAEPWPYRLPAGVPQHQAIRLTLDGDRRATAAPAQEDAVVLTLGDAVGLMPGIGLVVTPEALADTLAAAPRLREVAPQSLLFSFDPTAGHGRAAMAGFAAVQAQWPAEAVLECVVVGDGDLDAELASVAALVAAAGLRLDLLLVSPSVDRQSTPPGSAWPACPPLEAVYAAARRACPGLRLGGGMFSYFTELNRKRPPVALLDVVTHATNPIVHAADDRSVMQTLEALPFITRSTRAFIGAMPYRIGPSTIAMRLNPYGSRTIEGPADARTCMAGRDPRQRGLFAAAWLVGYAAATGSAGLEMLTVGALTGDTGLLDASAHVRPVFHAARALAALAGQARLACASDAEDRVLALAARSADGGTVLLAANLTPRPQPVRLPAGPAWCGAMLDAATMKAAAEGAFPAEVAIGDAVTLQPYAIGRFSRA